MSARQPRYEVVRTNAGYLARYVASNGKEIWRTSEVYTTRRRCIDALRILVNPLDCAVTRVGIRSIADKVPPVEVRDVDERTVTGAQPDEPASQAGRPVAGGAS